MTSLPVSAPHRATSPFTTLQLASPANRTTHGERKDPERLSPVQPTLAMLMAAALSGLVATTVSLISATERPRISGELLALPLLQIVSLVVALRLWGQVQRMTARHARESVLARSDELTGLPNRRHLNEQLHELIGGRGLRGRVGQTRGHPPGWSVLLIDVDQFKSVNDTCGHQAGDEVLRALSFCLRAALRSDDLLGRWGGEEFLAILPATAFGDALIAAERLRLAVSLQTFPHGHPLSISIGVASWLAGDNLERLVARADAGMYLAKRGGRNRVAFRL